MQEKPKFCHGIAPLVEGFFNHYYVLVTGSSLAFSLGERKKIKKLPPTRPLKNGVSPASLDHKCHEYDHYKTGLNRPKIINKSDKSLLSPQVGVV